MGIPELNLASAVGVLKAVAEPTRLRVLVLLAQGELNVKDLTRVLGQSQPRISRHLKLLAEAGLVERAPEGSWVYFRLAEDGRGGEVARQSCKASIRPIPCWCATAGGRRRCRPSAQEAAQVYFQSHAADWDKIRALHVAEADVEAAVSAALGAGPFDLLVDIGTGTGRMLELFAPRFRRGIGLDLSPADAGLRARQARAGGPDACAGAPGRHLRSAAGRPGGRRRRHAPGAALPERSRSAPFAKPRACWRRAGAC